MCSPAGVITYLAPCYTAGKNAEAVDESCIKHALLYFIPLVNVYCHAVVRGKIREKKNIEVRLKLYIYTILIFVVGD